MIYKKKTQNRHKKFREISHFGVFQSKKHKENRKK